MEKQIENFNQPSIEHEPSVNSAISVELSKIALESCVEIVDLNDGRLDNLKLKLGLIDRTKDKEPSLIIDGVDAEKAEKGIDCHHQLGDFMVGYIEGVNANNDFKLLGKYIDGDEMDFLLNINQVDADVADKNYYLMQIHDRVIGRYRSHQFPQKTADFDRLSDLRHSLKTNYIMNLNHEVADYIDSVGSKVNNIGQLIEKLSVGFLKTNTKSFEKDLSGLSNIDKRYFSDENFEKILWIIEGMRHEAAFKEMIYEMPDDVIEIDDADGNEDSHGIDVKLKVKLSSNRTNDGQYKYASKKEVSDGSFIEKELPVDIKASADKAKKDLEKQLSYPNPNHWVMWSHVYRQDFRLAVDYGETMIAYKNGEEPIYLKYDEQIAAMRKLDKIKYLNKGEKFQPESLDDRLMDIKREILIGINKLESLNQDR